MIHKKVPNNTLNKNPKGYCEFLPVGYGTKKFPVLWWLHGLGEVGNGSSDSLNKVYNITIANWLKTNDVPFIVIVPQDFSGYWNGSNGIKEFVQWCETQYVGQFDESQYHIAGLSSGGYGLRDFIIGNSDTYKKFATFTPMSTNFDAAVSKVQQIVDNNQKVWFHHGESDGGANMIGAVIHFHRALYDLDQKRSQLTGYESMGHSAWNEVYDSSGRTKAQLTGTINDVVYYNWLPTAPDWYAWLLSNGKVPVEPPIEPPVETIFLDMTKVTVENGKAVAIGSDGKSYSWAVGIV